MIKPLTPRQQSLIVNSVVRAIKSGDIEHLTKTAYNFLYLCSGFIAHYDLWGFRDYYRDTEKLRHDIILHTQANMWYNFTPRDRDYEYYMSKRDCYNAIVARIRG